MAKRKMKPKRRALARRTRALARRSEPEAKAEIIRKDLAGSIHLPIHMPLLPDGWADGCQRYMNELLSEMKPGDPLETLLCEQLIWCHHRIAHLARLAMEAESVAKSRVMHELVDRAMNTFRRGMLALREYRDKVRGRSVSVNQLNQAEHQNILLVQKNSDPRNTTNEQGANHGE